MKILKQLTSNAFVKTTAESITYCIADDFKILFTVKYKDGSDPAIGFYELVHFFNKKEEAMVHAEFESILKLKAFV